jgi:phosphate starvation-inducible membrane PsiE
MAAIRRFKYTSKRTQELIELVGHVCVESFHLMALFAIGATIVWAAVVSFLGMVKSGHASIEDVLLLFIYLELGAMVGIYFKTNHMPVRYMLYVAITALTRLLIGLVNAEHHPSDYAILIVTTGILFLSVAVVILRYGSYKFPAIRADNDDTDLVDSEP